MTMRVSQPATRPTMIQAMMPPGSNCMKIPPQVFSAANRRHYSGGAHWPGPPSGPSSGTATPSCSQCELLIAILSTKVSHPRSSRAPLLLGLDLGTGSVKALLLATDGRVADRGPRPLRADARRGAGDG